MATRKRGGYQRPSKPAAVSGPGALSQRTDGGPSVQFEGLPYGENKQLNDLASAAPSGQAGAPGAAASGPRRATPQGPDGIFGPTERPGEPLTAGVDMGPGAGAPPGPILEEDPNMMLRALAQAFPHPDLDRLLARVARG